MRLYKYIITIFLILFAVTLTQTNNRTSLLDTNPPFYNYQYSAWVDSLINTMTLEEKVGQLFMVAAYSNKGKEHEDKVLSLIKNQKIGGLIFFQGTPEKQIELTNLYQRASQIPLLIGGDWEWGLSMRLKKTILFPRQMMLGAIRNDSLIYQMGAEFARQIKLMGAHVNFAPVVDINNNHKNPVIGSRSFGEDRARVTDLSYMYMKGLQDNGILAVAKHFPGHGDTDTDSHKDLPIISHVMSRLDSVELYPFYQLFKEGLGGVMVAHLFVPALDSTPNTATTLSRRVSWDLLKKHMAFKGIAFTDALNMKGVSKFYKPGEADLKALLAGNDILLFPKDVPKAVTMIKKALEQGLLSMHELDGHVRKILALKRWTGAYKKQEIRTGNIVQKLNEPEVKSLQRKLIENAITLVQNQEGILPLKGLDKLKIASIAIGETKQTPFQKQLGLYTKIDEYFLNKYPTEANWKVLKKKLESYNLVIFSFHHTNRNPKKNYGISRLAIKYVERYAKNKPSVVSVFGNPYVLKNFQSLSNFKSVVVSYNDWDITQTITAQKIFGASRFLGQLPVSVNSEISSGYGLLSENIKRLKYTDSFDARIDDRKLYKIDSIVLNSIRKKAFPGCQILAARNGKVFYHKAFGHHTYKKQVPVQLSDLYDLASITKVLATTVSLMKLKDEHLFNIDANLVDYLPELKETNKASINIKDVLTHQARLQSWIPFYLETIKDDETKKFWYKNKPEKDWDVPIVDNMYINHTYKDSIYQIIYNTELREKKEYRYSDLGFYLMQKCIEKQTLRRLNKYVANNFYNSLGANRMLYLPLEHYSISEIVPTEQDDYYRHCLVHGYVHDMGAVMLGGVAGHAGLFSNANDVAKMMQMLLWKGSYGGKKYIDENTINQFTSCQFCPDNRRGLGFDKPEMRPNINGPTCDMVSASSFGHTGFTGTMVWADPENGLLYVFLSNRIHPKSTNNLILKLNTRTEIQTVLYESLL